MKNLIFGILFCLSSTIDRISSIGVQLSRSSPRFVEDQAVYVEHQICERDFGIGALDADGRDKQAHFRLLMREDLLDPGANLGFDGISAPGI